ncbi:GEVED domain-containing protein, partial [Xanthovirga aplysinae]|uniref:GEVED domain-containing protein n=1 Tax=Xanthovirga aplysinae TaxID=2529853 RepID=UPI0012BC00BF
MMRQGTRLFLKLFVCFTVFALFSSLNSRKLYGQSLRVVAYNVQIPGWNNHSTEVGNVLIDLEADVIGLSETRANQKNDIAQALGNDYELVEFFGNRNENEASIFFRTDRLTLIDNGVENVPLPPGFTGLTPYVNWARFEDQQTNLQFFFYSNHFPFPDTDARQQAQYNHANTLAQTIDEHIDTYGLPIIAGGDFNARPGSDIMNFLLEQEELVTPDGTYINPVEVLDSWDVAHPGDPRPPTVRNGNASIDYILVSPEVNVGDPTFMDTSTGGGAQPPSDHLPVVATITLPDDGGTPPSPEYCTSSGNTTYEWIASVEIDDFENNSGAEGYGDFTDQTVNLQVGNSSNFTLTPGFSGNSWPEYYRIWIDYNQDGDFNDAEELAFEGGPTNTAINGSFTPPATASLGESRMRISIRYNNPPRACGNIGDGEVEDYTVNISENAVASPPPPISIFPNPNRGLFKVSWTKGPMAISKLLIKNWSGKIVYQNTSIPQKDSFIEQINLSGVPKGIYFLEIIHDSGI